MNDDDSTITPIGAEMEPMVTLSALTKEQKRLEEAAVAASLLRTELANLRDSVRDEMALLVSEETLSRRLANEVLKRLGLPLIVTWTVTVTDERSNEDVLVVCRIEADDEDTAIDLVRNGISVSAEIQSLRVMVEVEYDGDGEVESASEVDVNDPDAVELDLYDFESSFEYDLQFTASPEEE